MIRGDLRNVALVAHWDGFTISKRHNQSSWMLEVAIMSTGTTTPIEFNLLLFILSTFILKTNGANILVDKKIKSRW